VQPWAGRASGRAALEWTEAITRVAETHVPDEVYERVRAQFDEQQSSR
jgi:alkylhydroperoxidase family enzyme